MFDDTNISEPPDPRIARTDAGLCALEELRLLGLATARAKSRQACREAENSDAATGRDAADVFERVSRGVRFIVALEARLGDYRAALVAGNPFAEFSPRHASKDPFSGDPPRREPDRMADRDRLRGHVLELVNPLSFEEEARERIYERMDEGMFESERYDAFLDLPLPQAVDAICKDLGVRPQYERWKLGNWPPWRVGAPPLEPEPEPEPDPGTEPDPAPAPPEAGDRRPQDALAPAGVPPDPPPYGDTG